MHHFNKLTKALAFTFIFITLTSVPGLVKARARFAGEKNGTAENGTDFDGGGSALANNSRTDEYYNHVNEALDRLIEMLYGDIEPKNEIFAWEPPHSSHVGHDNALHYTNEWLVHVTGGDQEANRIATAAGYENKGQVKDNICINAIWWWNWELLLIFFITRLV